MGEPSPAQRTLEAHCNAVRFLAAVEDGRWVVLTSEWPHLFVRVTGRDLEMSRTFSQDFRLECLGYPDPGPFVERWSFADTAPYGIRPAPPQQGSPGFVDALKDWGDNNQHGGIYRAWQRGAASHNEWANKFPDQAWHCQRDLTFIMEQLYALVSEQAVWLASRA